MLDNVSKITKNKTLKSILDSDLTKAIVRRGIKNLYSKMGGTNWVIKINYIVKVYDCVASIMAGITNVRIEKFIEEENDDLKRNFIGVSSSNSVTHFINVYRLAKKKGGTYRSNLPRTQWWRKKGNCFSLIAMDLPVVKLL